MGLLKYFALAQRKMLCNLFNAVNIIPVICNNQGEKGKSKLTHAIIAISGIGCYSRELMR